MNFPWVLSEKKIFSAFIAAFTHRPDMAIFGLGEGTHHEVVSLGYISHLITGIDKPSPISKVPRTSS